MMYQNDVSLKMFEELSKTVKNLSLLLKKMG
jgi:hypothetical protein